MCITQAEVVKAAAVGLCDLSLLTSYHWLFSSSGHYYPNVYFIVPLMGSVLTKI